MKKTIIIVLSCFLLAAACKGSKENASPKIDSPSGLTLVQVDEDAVALNWTPGGSDIKGYWVYMRTEASGFHTAPLNFDSPLPSDATSYKFTGLAAGSKFQCGVQALGNGPVNSEIIYAPEYTMLTAMEVAEAGFESQMAAPSGITIKAAGNDGIDVSWNAAAGASKYFVYTRTDGAESFGSPAAKVSETSCTLSGLATGTYTVAVQAVPEVFAKASKLALSEKYRLQDESKIPVINSISTSYAYALVNYTARTANATSEHGLCFSTEGLPGVEDQVLWGPSFPDGTNTVGQLIPNAVLEYGVDYQVCAYYRNGKNYFFSEPSTFRLDNEPALPELEWKKVANPAGVPSGVEVYATETPLKGRPFKAWYAVADCSGDIELRMVSPASLTTIDKLSESFNGDCYVMVNGGYFAWDSGWTSPYVIDGKRVGDGYGSSRTSDSQWTLTTPAVLGVDKDGKPGAYWWSARPNKAYYYNLPLPTVPDQAKYWYENSDAQLSAFPGPDQAWEPYNALSAGPMVLYDGKVVVDDSHNGQWYTTNYELMASDIFPGYLPDRTAIGYLEDGRMVLFVCDGRVDESDGASLPDLGMVMKSIGCVAAQNLDGGGSTGMMLGSTHLNTWEQGKGSARKMEYRAVKTAVGFFKKR
ncbi:MAG: phosphodiester glycosidase family protein [Bacteroidales bacterium]|nr:phosphodiester glycosidase family protein [Bacteroidales bacterium]